MAWDGRDSRFAAGPLRRAARRRCTALALCFDSLLSLRTRGRHRLMVDVWNLLVGVGGDRRLVRRPGRVFGLPVTARPAIGRSFVLHAMREHQVEPVYAAVEGVANRHQQRPQLHEYRHKGVVGLVQEASPTQIEFHRFRSEYQRAVTDR